MYVDLGRPGSRHLLNRFFYFRLKTDLLKRLDNPDEDLVCLSLSPPPCKPRRRLSLTKALRPGLARSLRLASLCLASLSYLRLASLSYLRLA